VTTNRRLQQVTSSMLWAAWADALGFISELTDAAGLRRRLGGDGELKEPVAWERRVGGRFGVTMPLPAGCYSDDTQLRLATARALSAKGFDVEAFTAVELTLWPAYALGGGRASKAAAAGFAKPNTPWFANFFEGWTNAGGNGAAMRIQPHVWAAPRLDDLGYLQDVLLNAITTHGHPRALVGAVLHAYSLGLTMTEHQVVRPDRWLEVLDGARAALSMLEGHELISSAWIPSWEKTTGSSFGEAWGETISETRSLLKTARQHVNSLADDQTPHGEAYAAMCQQLGLLDGATRGSGTATVVAALALAAAHPQDPRQCALVACRALGTDTDTIATMAAAIVGAASEVDELPTPLLDLDYLREQAVRLVEVSASRSVEPTRYPDLLTWQPPRSQLEAVGLVEGKPALAGLALLAPLTEGKAASSRGAQWQWFRSDLGPTFLLKHREPGQMQELPDGNRPLRGANPATHRAKAHDAGNEQLSIMDEVPSHISTVRDDRLAADLTRRYQKGATIRALAESTGQSYGFVHRVLSESGVLVRGQDAARTRYQNRERHPALVERTASTRVDVDQMLEWVKRNNYSDNSIGYAVRRLSRLGTIEQLVAFTTALRVAIGTSLQPDDGP
jgi:ADP-ribosylglycohydrolase